MTLAAKPVGEQPCQQLLIGSFPIQRDNRWDTVRRGIILGKELPAHLIKSKWLPEQKVLFIHQTTAAEHQHRTNRNSYRW